MSILSIGVFIILIVLAGFHVYWAFGGTFAADKVIPEVDGKAVFEPGIFATLNVAVILSIIAVIGLLLGFCNLSLLGYGQYIVYAGWVIFAALIFRAIGDFNLVGFFKKIKNTEFDRYDTKYYSPLCFGLAVAFFILLYFE